MKIDITPELEASLEASIVSLAGDWASEWADEDVRNLADINKWGEVFTNRFKAYYVILFRAIIEARKYNSEKTVIARKRSTKP